jgi:hypothetical protein
MKNIIIMTVLIAVFGISACGKKVCKDNCSIDNTQKRANMSVNKADTTNLVCKLTTEEQMKRGEELRNTVFKEYEKLNEFPEAVQLVYSDSKKYAPILVDFINTERACCPFFTFELKFEPNSDNVSLTIGGSPKIKELVKALLKG